MVKVKSITVERHEGPHNSCDIPVTCLGLSKNVWEQANEQLHAWSHTAPKAGGGYDKCSVRILYEDGHIHQTRFDLHHPDVEPVNLIGYVRNEARFYAGLAKPARLTDAQYATVINRNDAACLRHFIEDYDIGYAPAKNN